MHYLSDGYPMSSFAFGYQER